MNKIILYLSIKAGQTNLCLAESQILQKNFLGCKRSMEFCEFYSFEFKSTISKCCYIQRPAGQKHNDTSYLGPYTFCENQTEK